MLRIDDNWQSLPRGHYGRMDAENALKAEYDQSHTRLNAWRKKTHLYTSLTPENAIKLVNTVAFNLGEPRKIVRHIELYSRDVVPWAHAHYSRWGKTISFKGGYIDLGSLIHEATHFYASDHDDKFCDMQDLLMEATIEELRNNSSYLV